MRPGFDQLFERESAMAHAALGSPFELPESLAEGRVEKQRIIAEAACPARRQTDAAAAFGAEKVLGIGSAGNNQSEYAHEACGAPRFGNAGEFGEQLRVVACIVGVGSTVARRMNAGCAAERLDLQPRIVCQRRNAGERRERARFLQRVGFEGVSILGYGRRMVEFV